MEAEERGEGETLARHRKLLLDFAARCGLSITKEYSEVVTGENIAARPMMQQLLQDVEQGLWAGVLVVEVERLARGDTIDQGIVAQTFKYTDTKILTPVKTYDPSNEFDEEYFEFGLFMSRREYKTINRRLQAGRIASVKEGKYVSNKAPYGYVRRKLEKEKGYTLDPHPDEADVVRMIYEWYVDGTEIKGEHRRIGVQLISRKLNSMGIKPKYGDAWVPVSIRDIIMNPVYAGKIRWNWRPQTKKMVGGQLTVERPRSKNALVTDGLHPAIVSQELFDRAQQIMSANAARPVGLRHKVSNPLSGLVFCGKCGRAMQRRPYTTGQEDSLICTATSCDNISSALAMVERRILDALADWVADYKLRLDPQKERRIVNQTAITEKALQRIDAELSDLDKQKSSLHDLLERGVYDVDTFMSRSSVISDRIKSAKADREKLASEIAAEKLREANRIQLVPRIEHLLYVYNDLPSAAAKNELLKEVLEKVVYIKEVNGRWHHPPDAFDIQIFPRIPHSDNQV